MTSSVCVQYVQDVFQSSCGYRAHPTHPKGDGTEVKQVISEEDSKPPEVEKSSAHNALEARCEREGHKGI